MNKIIFQDTFWLADSRQIPNQKKPVFGQNKVRADIFPRFFGSFSIRKGRFGIGRRLDGGNRRPLLMFIRRSVSVGGKIGSDIFKCSQNYAEGSPDLTL